MGHRARHIKNLYIIYVGVRGRLRGPYFVVSIFICALILSNTRGHGARGGRMLCDGEAL